MLYHNVHVMAHYLRAIDAGTVALLSALVWWLGGRLGAWPLATTGTAAAVFCSVLWLGFMALGDRLRVYHARRTTQIGQELLSLSEVNAYATGLGCAASELMTGGLPARAYLAIFAVNAAVLPGLRLVMRVVIRRLRRRGHDFRAWLIVGRNPRTARLVEEILANPHYGILIEEIVDLEARPGEDAVARLDRFGRPPLSSLPAREVSSVEAIRGILAERVIDEVLVTLPLRSRYDEVQSLLTICGEAGISLRMPLQGFRIEGAMVEVGLAGHLPVVTHYTGPANHNQLALKRLIDVVGSLAGLILLWPVFVAVALAVRLSSPGPVLFFQTRAGLHGRQFRMIKFRSMVQGAPELQEVLAPLNQADGVAFKIRHDPRITPVGRVLRRYHLDELPQLWNVLVGDMSLVGPRPLPPSEAHGNEWWQRRRLSMPPGLTCSFQLRPNYHTMPFGDWMRSDLQYIDGWSLTRDLRLIASTLTTVVRGYGW